MKNNNDRLKALSAMQNLCSKSEKCVHDIRTKLKNRKLSPPDVEWIIEKLLEDKFVDEDRYTSFFVRDKLRLNHWGRLKIRQALATRQIPEELRDKYLMEIDQDEYRRILHEELEKKGRTMKEKDPYARKVKLFRYAAGKGFETDLIYKEVGNISEERENDF